MFIDKPTCNLKYCRFFSDYNCMAEKIRHERCPYKIMRDDVDALGYINATGHLEKKEDYLQRTCKHKNPDGTDAWVYDSEYEMRSSQMHCSICGKSKE